MSGLTLSIPDSKGNSEQPRSNVAQAIADQLCVRIGPARFNLWFTKQTFVEDTNGNSILVYAENKFSLQRIQNTFGSEIKTVVSRVCGPQFEIGYRIAGSDQTTGPLTSSNESGSLAIQPAQLNQANLNPSETANLPNQQNDSGDSNNPASIRIHNQEPSPRPNVSDRKPVKRVGVNSFWFGPDNRLIKAGVEHLFEQPGQFSPLFIYGSTGSGKTHLLEAITNDYRRRLKKKRCIYLSAEQFTSQFVGSLRGGSGLPMFRRKYRDLDLLAIDDIQFLAGKRATLGEFQHTIDNLIRTGKQVVGSSDRPPIELTDLGNDISARLSAGLTCPLEYPDFEGRLHIVERMCSERNLKIPTDVKRLISDQLTRDVRRLSGAVNRLHAYSVSINRQITTETAQQVLCDLFSLSGPNCTSMVSIEQAVCEFCGIQPNELKSSSRRKRICAARMLAMYLSRQYTGSAFSEIGDYFGGRSHSTVIAAERKVANWLKNDEGICVSHATYPAKEVLRRIESNLRIG